VWKFRFLFLARHRFALLWCNDRICCLDTFTAGEEDLPSPSTCSGFVSQFLLFSFKALFQCWRQAVHRFGLFRLCLHLVSLVRGDHPARRLQAGSLDTQCYFAPAAARRFVLLRNSRSAVGTAVRRTRHDSLLRRAPGLLRCCFCVLFVFVKQKAPLLV
jgi:hypothetical protein